MPIPSPFHERTSPLCTSYRWKDWAGYCAVSSYDTSHEREYFAFREAAGLLDVTPLYKYEVTGKDAAAQATLVLEQTANLSVSLIVSQVRTTAVDMIRGWGLEREEAERLVREAARTLQ